jgi:hypothetical protein
MILVMRCHFQDYVLWIFSAYICLWCARSDLNVMNAYEHWTLWDLWLDMPGWFVCCFFPITYHRDDVVRMGRNSQLQLFWSICVASQDCSPEWRMTCRYIPILIGYSLPPILYIQIILFWWPWFSIGSYFILGRLNWIYLNWHAMTL